MAFVFGDHVIDVDRREFPRRAELIALEPQVFDLLVYLVRNRDRVVSKEELLGAVWGGRIVSESTLTSRINAVRKAVGDSGEEQRLIRTVPRKGIRFVGIVQEEPTSAPASSPAPRLSIMVLPFTNLSHDPEQEYFADAITDDLTTDLTQISGSVVIARSTAFTYKGKPIDVKQVGRDLGVRYVLEGSAQLSGSRVRVNAQLIDAESGAHLWADQFDANRGDLLEMQDEIVRRLSWPLEIRLIDVDAARVARTPPGNLDAQDLALQCMAGSIINPLLGSEYNPALSFCERALEIDNRNAIALTFMAFKYIGPVIRVESTDPQAAIRHADELVSRALAIDRNFDWLTLARPMFL